ncbi:uncharacterized protein LOC131619193 [Vicia villosa]|uniref:uncharacterized protein LOC131619193 n=1 Tax=Vicia villosa TaxID=3911 RepID=UPI00273ACEC1|nr:uncharacterized protein LOC131619193 [Vicia villosa]
MQKGGWTRVSYLRGTGSRWDTFPFGGRNRNFPLVNKEVISMYVSEFPEDYTARKIFNLFGCVGYVVEVAISPRRNKVRKRFGFARFTEVEDGRLLAVRLDNIIIAGRKIHVNLPRYQRGFIGGVVKRGVPRKGAERRMPLSANDKNRKLRGAENNRAGKSYAEVVAKVIGVAEMKEVEKPLFSFQSKEEFRSRFVKAYVSHLRFPGTAYNVQTHLEIEGVFGVKVTPLGGNSCLLEESEEGFIEDLIREGDLWWKDWFSVIKMWEEGSIDGSRDAWFRVYGIPLHVWNSEFFVALAGSWGRFICVDENTAKSEVFDVARVMVNIPITLKIPDTVTVSIDGGLHNLCVREDAAGMMRMNT